MALPIIAGQVYPTNKNGNLVVIEYQNRNRIIVKFLATGFITKTHAIQIRNGQVKDLLHPNIHGVGFMGDGDYIAASNGNHTKKYAAWHNMLARCYDPKVQAKQPTYIGCSVDPVWHNFQTFAEWYEANYVEGYHIDKDLLVPGNKVYGPDACVFVALALNALLADHAAKRGKCPLGVYLHQGRYKAQISINGKRKHLGRFDTPEAAHAAYNAAKAIDIRRHANLSTTPAKLIQPLIRLADSL